MSLAQRNTIIVSGGDGGYHNLGDELLLEATKRFYRGYLDRFEIVIIMAMPPENPSDGFRYVAESPEAYQAAGLDPARVSLLHFYGGGYLNSYWCEAKMRTYRHFTSGGLDPQRVAFTGQGLGPLDAVTLEEVARVADKSLVFGTRDRSALVEATLTFDDTIELFRAPMPAEQTAIGPLVQGPVALNFRLEPYVGFDEPSARTLVDSVETYLEARGLEAFAFGMVEHVGFDEGAVISRVLEESGSRCIVFSPRPVDFDELMSRLKASRVVVSTSYHVVLLALYAGRPVVALYGSEYYRLKFEGLASILDTRLLTVSRVEDFQTGMIDTALAKADAAAQERLTAVLTEMQALNRVAHDMIAGVLTCAQKHRRVAWFRWPFGTRR